MSLLRDHRHSVAICAVAALLFAGSPADRAAAAAIEDEGIEYYDSIELGYAKDISQWIINEVIDDYVEQTMTEFKKLNSACFPRPNVIVMPAIRFKVRTAEERWTKQFVKAIVRNYSKNELIVMWRGVNPTRGAEKMGVFEIDRKRATTGVIERFVAHLKYQIDWRLLPSVREHCAEKLGTSP
ncbi:MAG: hypothetical protein AAGD13_12995 [Pseudomonadota bacterium]